jgi:hypothetical protein
MDERDNELGWWEPPVRITWKKLKSMEADPTTFYFSQDNEGFQIVAAPKRFPALYRWGVLVKNYSSLSAAKRGAQDLLAADMIRIRLGRE